MAVSLFPTGGGTPGGASGTVQYNNAGAFGGVTDGTNGQFLKTNGAGGLSWATIAGGGDMLASTYDPAAIAQQVVGLTASQTLTNKTFVAPILGTPASGTLTNATGLPLSTGVTGTLPYANFVNASAVSVLVGRGAASGAGVMQQITLGSGLTMTGTVLSSSGGGGGTPGGSTGQIQFNNAGSFAGFGYVTKTATYTLTATDGVVEGLTNAFTVTLPTAVGVTGQQYVIKNLQTANAVTVATTSAQTIDGASTYSVTNGAVTVMSDGANWRTLSSLSVGLTAIAQGDLIYGSATSVLSTLAKNATATRYLSNTGTSNNPAWAQINLGNGVFIASQATGDLLYASSSSVWARVGIGSSGQILAVSGGLPTWITNTAGDVVGPSSAIGNTLAAFDGATGKLLEGTLVLVSGADLSGGSFTGTGLLQAGAASNIGWFGSTKMDAPADGTMRIRPTAGTLGAGIVELGSVKMDGTTSGALTHIVPATVTSYSIKWPSAVAGGAGYSLTSDASGNLSWTNISGGSSLTVGTTTITSGTSGNYLYNNAGVLGERTFGTGVTTFLATPSSTNFFAALTGAITDSNLSLLVKPAVAVVATTNLTLSGEQTIDGATTSTSLVLATAQTTGSQNGPWVSAAGAWARPGWYSAGSTTQAPQFLTTFVRLGTVYQGSTWRMTTAAVTVDTTSTTWTQTPMILGSTAVGGLLPVANGGFGVSVSSIAKGGMVTGSGAGTFAITAVGSDGQVWTADAASTGGAKWAAGGSGSPGGSNTQVQFNDSSAFGGDAGMTFVKGTGTFFSTIVTGGSLRATGTAGAGFGELLTQSSPPSAPASGFRLYADSTGRQSWIRASDGFTRTWDAVLTANRVYTLPDATTTIAGLAVAQTWTAAQTNSTAGAASTPSALFSGTIFSGGSGTTTKPLVLIETAGATSTGWYSTGGTMFGVNCASGFVGYVVDFQANGLTKWRIDNAGNVIQAGGLTVSAGGLTITGTSALAFTTMSSALALTFNGTASNPLIKASGTWFSGGSATTTTPALMVVATAGTNWSTSGTGIGANAASGFTGNLIDLQTNNTRAFAVDSTGLMTAYKSVATVGWGSPAIYGTGRATGQTAANASVATYTCGAADGTFMVSANVLVTTSSAEAFTVTVDYTDEGNTARTETLSFTVLAGTATPNIAFANGAVPYSGLSVRLRCKASTALTVKTAAGGTYTGCTYNVEADITQVK